MSLNYPARHYGDTVYHPGDEKNPRWVLGLCEQAAPVRQKRNAEAVWGIKRLAALDQQITDLMEERKEVEAHLRAKCSHPMSARVVLTRSVENEFGTGFLPSPTEVHCTDCRQKIAETEPR